MGWVLSGGSNRGRRGEMCLPAGSMTFLKRPIFNTALTIEVFTFTVYKNLDNTRFVQGNQRSGRWRLQDRKAKGGGEDRINVIRRRITVCADYIRGSPITKGKKLQSKVKIYDDTITLALTLASYTNDRTQGMLPYRRWSLRFFTPWLFSLRETRKACLAILHKELGD